MSEKHYTFDGQEDPHFDTELELRMWMAGKNSEIAAQRERELARLQDENRRLRAFVEDRIVNSNTFMMGRELWTQLQQQAAALLAGTPAEDSELAALRRQVRVLERDRRGLMDALIEQIGADNTLALMNDIRLASMKPAEGSK